MNINIHLRYIQLLIKLDFELNYSCGSRSQQLVCWVFDGMGTGYDIQL